MSVLPVILEVPEEGVTAGRLAAALAELPDDSTISFRPWINGDGETSMLIVAVPDTPS